MQRRHFLTAAASFLAAASIGTGKILMAAHNPETGKVTELDKKPEEWKGLVSDDAWEVLFEEATERAGSSPLDNEKREGTFVCAACYLPLFPMKFKFDSGTGWPSFFDYHEGHLDFSTDFKLIYPRKEYHCASCGGHQGHVFKDGPEPTGLRYCNNGVALKFIPADEPLPELRG